MKLYLDQMFRLEFAEKLRAEGHDVLRASELGQDTADDIEFRNHIVILSRSAERWINTTKTSGT